MALWWIYWVFVIWNVRQLFTGIVHEHLCPVSSCTHLLLFHAHWSTRPIYPPLSGEIVWKFSVPSFHDPYTCATSEAPHYLTRNSPLLLTDIWKVEVERRLRCAWFIHYLSIVIPEDVWFQHLQSTRLEKKKAPPSLYRMKIGWTLARNITLCGSYHHDLLVTKRGQILMKTLAVFLNRGSNAVPSRSVSLYSDKRFVSQIHEYPDENLDEV